MTENNENKRKEPSQIGLTMNDGNVAISVPKVRFEEFNKKFCALLQKFSRGPVFSFSDESYQQRTNLTYGLASGCIALVFSLLALLLVTILLPSMGVNDLSAVWRVNVVVPVLLGPFMFFLVCLPIMVRYTPIGWIDAQVGEKFVYLQLNLQWNSGAPSQARAFLVNRIKDEVGI